MVTIPLALGFFAQGAMTITVRRDGSMITFGNLEATFCHGFFIMAVTAMQLTFGNLLQPPSFAYTP